MGQCHLSFRIVKQIISKQGRAKKKTQSIKHQKSCKVNCKACDKKTLVGENDAEKALSLGKKLKTWAGDDPAKQYCSTKTLDPSGNGDWSRLNILKGLAKGIKKQDQTENQNQGSKTTSRFETMREDPTSVIDTPCQNNDNEGEYGGPKLIS